MIQINPNQKIQNIKYVHICAPCKFSLKLLYSESIVIIKNIFPGSDIDQAEVHNGQSRNSMFVHFSSWIDDQHFDL